MPLDRPIPAFYCCYLLRSISKPNSVYIGSTPHPVRRLRQHNGLAKGGAVRTSRASLRPWEMSCVVTGFPSHIAALQFEWAWQNPHITLHIPPESRLQHATQKKRSGHPKRPRHTVTSLLSNLHLLLRVPSFSRWPLEVRFFSEDVHKSWLRWSKNAIEPIRDSINIIQDIPSLEPVVTSSVGDSNAPTTKKRKLDLGGIPSLVVDYTDEKPHVAKAKDIIDFEREGSCIICTKDLEHDAGIYAICPNPTCESVTHLTCLSKHFLQNNEELVPVQGNCPSCKAELRWVDIVRELTLRMRGQKEVEKLLRVNRSRKGKDVASSPTMLDSDDELEEDELLQEIASLEELAPGMRDGAGDSWRAMDDSEDSDDLFTDHPPLPPSTKESSYRTNTASQIVIEDSDWDEAEVSD